MSWSIGSPWSASLRSTLVISTHAVAISSQLRLHLIDGPRGTPVQPLHGGDAPEVRVMSPDGSRDLAVDRRQDRPGVRLRLRHRVPLGSVHRLAGRSDRVGGHRTPGRDGLHDADRNAKAPGRNPRVHAVRRSGTGVPPPRIGVLSGIVHRTSSVETPSATVTVASSAQRRGRMRPASVRQPQWRTRRGAPWCSVRAAQATPRPRRTHPPGVMPPSR